MDGNHASSVSAKGGLTVTQTSGAGTKVGTSDPMVACGCAMAHRLKGTPGITGLYPANLLSLARSFFEVAASRNTNPVP